MAAEEKRRSTSYLTLLDNSACPLSLPGGFINAVVADEVVVAAISVEYT
jgi:hypothetical protein